ncbi:hypothetical protein H5410_056136 [Solanum commersonii]|uniref:Uncharacterized protein n=1 Tax=Solanum commersonii TaxID=4109 RepID=A0A9J5WKE1_SOLCO|nr:hypothetical protein H5410_056136 [Solanum commersonii]
MASTHALTMAFVSAVSRRWCVQREPWPSSIGFCIRDMNGDLVYAATKGIEEGTNIIVEARQKGRDTMVWNLGGPLEYCYGGTLTFSSYQGLSSEEKRLLNMDKAQTSNLAIRRHQRAAQTNANHNHGANSQSRS